MGCAHLKWWVATFILVATNRVSMYYMKLIKILRSIFNHKSLTTYVYQCIPNNNGTSVSMTIIPLLITGLRWNSDLLYHQLNWLQKVSLNIISWSKNPIASKKAIPNRCATWSKQVKGEEKQCISGMKMTQDCVKMGLYELWHKSPLNVNFLPENPGHSINKVKLLLCIINHHIMKTKGILEVELHVFLRVKVNRSKRSASHSNYRIFPSITRVLSIQKRSVNGKKRWCTLYNECALCN
jgi:hypothetical protein